MAHGRNNPTGSIGFSPLLITLFAPVAFMGRAWVASIATFFIVMAWLLVWATLCHARDLRRAATEQLERERRGF